MSNDDGYDPPDLLGEIDRLLALRAAGTPGPWHAELPWKHWRIRTQEGHYVLETSWVRTPKDADFIAACGSNLGDVLTRCRQAVEERDRLRAGLEAIVEEIEGDNNRNALGSCVQIDAVARRALGREELSHE